ncbi:Mo25-like protein [Conidiobolus coronatus NRRL 28638]|uniref:Mo25-like protein n=1 Tax=Conidiobolus coronatus (strain ATCC 28846 / CBS 209.66 / NRRL 28638) TaxID=796925 RepID=A0A137PA47_CONC2|nr:Mo25-like protein [Conidiobolus coronatus NRRL 28638]|eukprot:KXN71801.1 Mo25-like protein [Conidiobolus coronatus NRRL 28638]
MNFLFKSKSKSPAELVRGVRESIPRLELPDKKGKEDATKYLSAMKNILLGDSDHEPSPDLVAQLSQEIYTNDLLYLLISNLHKLEFETRKDVAQIFNNLLRRKLGTRLPTVEYLASKENIIFLLIKGYENPDITLNCGMMLRECIRYEALARIILYSPSFFKFFDYVEIGTFDIASDAFATFRELLTKHKLMVAEFLDKNYDEFFKKYTELLNSPNYVTKRQSLKLLNEILLDRSNFNVMTRYISVGENLKLMMILLRDQSRNIQFEAFHVFKVFVANPNKSKPVLEILKKNKEKLLSFLSNFHNDRSDDQQFHDEKAFLLKQVEKL